MSKFERFLTTAALDGVLLDIAIQIEPSHADRRITENRYRRLKEHLERPSSALAPYLKAGRHLIYAQGSVATSTTIINGADDDRFDIDAIVEMDVPAHWSEHDMQDILEKALQGFPGVVKIVRCTRCIQLQFPFMHMDVTVMDRARPLAVERAGTIPHAPDEGKSYRVASNPWGFTAWFRSVVGVGQDNFVEQLRKRRAISSRSRLRALDDMETKLAKAEQVDLPPMIPSAIDAQEAVALKLAKRYLNLRYEPLDRKRPPSIYLVKRMGTVGYVAEGLTGQLVVFAESTAAIMRQHLAAGTRPAEENPSYPPDKINDRWPAQGMDGRRDMQLFAEALEHLAQKLRRLARAPLTEIVAGMSELFGERVGAGLKKVLAEQFDTRAGSPPNQVQTGTGNVKAPALVKSSPDVRAVPRHNFHRLILDEDADDEA
ncbi:MAG TPA: nucleotidyltransferase [Hyphomicrobiaceae bacterium]|nr:nucleotidyltransferase [Hyphomicrobiaceae bacterium]